MSIDYSKIDELFDQVIESGDLARLQELVELEGGPEYIDTPLILLAQNMKQTEMLEWLLQRGFDPNQTCAKLDSDLHTALYWASFSRQLEVMEILARYGGSVVAESPEDGHTSLHTAAENGDPESVRFLLERADGRAALEVFDYVDRKPLSCAVDANCLECARLLLEAGADVNALAQVTHNDRIGDTPLRRAVWWDKVTKVEMVKLLLEYGADPDRPGWMWGTARHDVHNLAADSREQVEALFEVPALKKLHNSPHNDQVARQLLADLEHHGVSGLSLSWEGTRRSGETVQVGGQGLASFSDIRLFDHAGKEVGRGDFNFLVLTVELDFRAFWTRLELPGKRLEVSGRIPSHVWQALTPDQRSWIIMDCRNGQWRSPISHLLMIEGLEPRPCLAKKKRK